jgi:hypothetical protein
MQLIRINETLTSSVAGFTPLITQRKPEFDRDVNGCGAVSTTHALKRSAH